MVKGTWIALGVIGAIVLLVLGAVGSAVGTYNAFVTETEAVDAQSKQVDVAYQTAFRLVPQLVNLTTTFMQNEREVITNATALRGGLVDAGNGTFEAKEAYLQDMIRFVALVGNRAEAYPELRSNELFQDTMASIVTAENKIQMEKVRYNDRVETYNAHRRQCCIPLLVAGMLGFEPKEYVGFEGRPNTSTFPEGAQL